jgi:hypothetical protein
MMPSALPIVLSRFTSFATTSAVLAICTQRRFANSSHMVYNGYGPVEGAPRHKPGMRRTLHLPRGDTAFRQVSRYLLLLIFNSVREFTARIPLNQSGPYPQIAKGDTVVFDLLQ